VAAARVVSPADLANLGLGNSYNFTRETGQRTNVRTGLKDGFGFDGGNAGNPNLDPYRATQVNASYENYFGKGDIASAEVFFKQVDSFEVIKNVPTFVNDDFGGTTSNVSTPENAGHGQIAGLELGLQYLFDATRIPVLDGFGVAGNYTYSSSISDQVTSFTLRAPIPGVSRDNVTVIAFYEKYGFALRLSYTWRDRALNDGIGGTTFAFGGKTYEVFQAPYGQLDAKIGYDFNQHWGVYFSAQNITNSALHTYLQYPNEPYTYDDSGPRLFLGTRLKF
jgi:TonB-dependent receptor